MRNFFLKNKPLEPKKIPHSGPSEPQPDEEPVVEEDSTDTKEESDS
jgi:hypothetical protein